MMAVYKVESEVEKIVKAGHPPMANKVVLIDFDGTLFPFGIMFDTDAKPIKGAVEFVRFLKEQGFKIGIFTSRLSKRWLKTENQDRNKHRVYVKYMCKFNGIPCDFITAEKIPAEFYVDDKAAPFGGDWEVTRKWYGQRT